MFTACCEKEVVERYELTSFEKDLIPFTEHSRLNYINEEGEIVVGLTQPKTIEIVTDYEDEESWSAWEHEKLTNYVGFEDREFVFEILVEKSAAGEQTFFEIRKSILDTFGSTQYFLPDCERENQAIEDLLTDISLHGFEFNDVYLFLDCYMESEIEKMVYSAEKGIEFITYKNGNYLKLQE